MKNQNFLCLVIFLLLSPVLHAIKYVVEEEHNVGTTIEVKSCKHCTFKVGQKVRLRPNAGKICFDYAKENPGWRFPEEMQEDVMDILRKNKVLTVLNPAYSNMKKVILQHGFDAERDHWAYPVSAVMQVRRHSKALPFTISDLRPGDKVKISRRKETWPPIYRGKVVTFIERCIPNSNFIRCQVFHSPSHKYYRLPFSMDELDQHYGINRPVTTY